MIGKVHSKVKLYLVSWVLVDGNGLACGTSKLTDKREKEIERKKGEELQIIGFLMNECTKSYFL
jgi:hypothetical protein